MGANMLFGGVRIISVETIDDGTTGGKEVFFDDNGGQWERTPLTKETCGTGDTIGTLENGRIWT